MICKPEQIAERDAWERRLVLGQCSLEEGLMMMLHSGAPATPYLIERLERAFSNYATGAFLTPGEKKPRNLADEFGTVKWDTQGVKAELRARDVYELVTELHVNGGLPLSGTAARVKGTPTAFSEAARMLSRPDSAISERSVIEWYYSGKQLHDLGAGV